MRKRPAADPDVSNEEARAAAAAFSAIPGVLLPHMKLPPPCLADLEVAGPCRWDGPPLACPPDGLCFLYAWLASQDPAAWAAVDKDQHGFVTSPAEEQAWKLRATALLKRILNCMDLEGQEDMASRLRGGAYPGDEEFSYYARVLGGAFLITPIDEARGLRAIHGNGPVCCELGFTYSRDASGHSSGHYVLLRSWQPLPAVLEPTSVGAVVPQSPESLNERPASSALKPPLVLHAIALTDSDTEASPTTRSLVEGTEGDGSEGSTLVDPDPCSRDARGAVVVGSRGAGPSTVRPEVALLIEDRWALKILAGVIRPGKCEAFGHPFRSTFRSAQQESSCCWEKSKLSTVWAPELLVNTRPCSTNTTSNIKFRTQPFSANISKCLHGCWPILAHMTHRWHALRAEVP